MTRNDKGTGPDVWGAELTRRRFVGVAGGAVAAVALGGALSGCTGDAATGTGSSADDEAGTTTIEVAFKLAGKPTTYNNDDGEPDGYEVQVVKRVAERLDGYTFNFTGVDQTAVFAGLSSNRYQLGLTNSFWTPERAENYLLPSQNIGVSVLGILTRSEHADVTSLSEAAAAGLSLVPILAGDGNYYVAEYYNEQNPDNQIELTATDDGNAFTEGVAWVAEGRYDIHLFPLQYYNALVVDEDGAYHEYYDQLNFTIIGATKTWSFLSNESTEFEADYSAALKELYEEGVLAELSEEYFDGVNNFEYLTDDTQNYNFV